MNVRIGLQVLQGDVSSVQIVILINEGRKFLPAGSSVFPIMLNKRKNYVWHIGYKALRVRTSLVGRSIRDISAYSLITSLFSTAGKFYADLLTRFIEDPS